MAELKRLEAEGKLNELSAEELYHTAKNLECPGMNHDDSTQS
jgi:hypothetical protein